MTSKEANSKAHKLFNQWRKEFCNKSINIIVSDEHFKALDQFKDDCRALHNVVGVYDYLTDKNALKMASICSCVRFVQPYEMLMQLQKTTKTY